MSSKTRRILFVLTIVVVMVLTTTPPIAARTAESPPLLSPSVPMLDVADEAAKIGNGIFEILDWLLGSNEANEEVQ